MDGIFGDLRPAESGEPTRWLFDALRPFRSASVGSVVPPGFPAYAALAHGDEPDDDQREGDVEESLVAQLVSNLASATANPERAWFCYWNGWAWTASRTRLAWPPVPTVEDIPIASTEVAALLGATPLVGNQYRRYYVFAGALPDVAGFRDPDGFFQAPSLWWPDDRAWIVATEIDLSWTYVGAESAVIEEILDAWPHPVRRVTTDEPNAWP